VNNDHYLLSIDLSGGIQSSKMYI